MSVTEVLMQPGRWELGLLPTTPKSVRDQLGFFGHVLITPSRVSPRLISDAAMLGLSRYTGVLRRKPSRFEIGGVGLAMWLGDEDGKSDIFPTGLTLTAQSFSTWVSNIRPVALSAGTVTAIAGTLTKTFRYVDRRSALNFVMDVFNGEWRISPDGKLHAGPQASVYVATPTAIAVKRGGGREVGIVGIRATDLELDEHVEDYSTRCIVLDSSNTSVGSATNASPYLDLFGNAVDLQRVIESPQATATEGNSIATNQLGRFDSTQRHIELSTDDYDVTGAVKAGDTIYVYDPEIGLIDTANQVRYQGEFISPKSIRVIGITWPVQRGMGVYYRSGAGVYTDLSDFVDFETGDTRLDVGRRSKKLSTNSPHDKRIHPR